MAFTTSILQSKFRALCLGAIVAALGGMGMADAEPPTDCCGEAPLLDLVIPLNDFCERTGFSEGSLLGEWRLPMSPRRPQVLTAARMKLKRGERGLSTPTPNTVSDFKAEFSFPDPLPYGLPFTFQRLDLQVEKEDASAVSSGSLDWSASCTNPGRSIFPGQSFEDALTLPCAVGTPERNSGFQLRIRLWGARM